MSRAERLLQLMLSEEEIEALVLGSRWVAQRTDSALAEAARNALAKINAVLPPELRHELESNALLVPPAVGDAERHRELAQIRLAIRREHRLRIAYRDGEGHASERLVWPFAVGFFDHAQVVAAWCESRNDFRHFRIDRIATLEMQEDRYPRRRQALLQDWRDLHGVTAGLE